MPNTLDQKPTLYPEIPLISKVWILWYWHFRNVNFVTIGISDMWKLRFLKCEFCKNCNFRKVNFVKIGIFKMWIFGQIADFCPSMGGKEHGSTYHVVPNTIWSSSSTRVPSRRKLRRERRLLCVLSTLAFYHIPNYIYIIWILNFE